MITVLALSIAIRIVALAWSVVLARRLRDWRMALLTATLALMALRQGFSLHSLLGASVPSSPPPWLDELPGLVVSILVFVFVVSLERLLLVRRKEAEERRRYETAIRQVAEAVTQETGGAFLRRLVTTLSRVIGCDWAFVATLEQGRQSVHAEAVVVCDHGAIGEPFRYTLVGSPCEMVAGRETFIATEGVTRAFPQDRLLPDLGIEGYIGTPLFDFEGKALGLLVCLFEEPIEEPAFAHSVLRIFAARCAGELERAHSEQALRSSESRYRRVFEESRDAIFISTPEGVLVDINPAGVELFGYESREEMLAIDIVRDLYWDPKDRQALQERLAERGWVQDHEVKLRRKDGSEVTVLETSTAEVHEDGRARAYWGILRDVSRQRHLEEQLQQSQRMEAVGRMAGGLAHDFNNLLTVVNGHADLMADWMGAEHPLAADLTAIRSAGERGASLTRQLLAIGRRQAVHPQPVDVNRILQGVRQLLKSSLGESVELDLRLSRKDCIVEADPGQLEQVLLNLSLNAQDAMPGGGELVLETEVVQILTGSGPDRPAWRPGDYVLLRARDTGVGMSDEVRQHVFEPFFTTKEPGRGTGLGLAVVYGIVEQSGGRIEVHGVPGGGSTFEIYLPRLKTASLVEEESRDQGRARIGKESILVVEDEAPVRMLVKQMLTGLGYRVLEAPAPETALEIAEDARERIDLLLADVVMPRMNGFVLAERLSELRPECPVLFMSGRMPGGQTTVEESFSGRCRFLPKPFTREMLSERVRDLLDG